MNKFEIVSQFKPKGDQVQAVEELYEGLKKGIPHQTLLGVTGSGKTFTIANVIEKINKPTLIISHNKTLAAQLYGEFRALFPKNAIEYFVSYYDYYQPEAYLESKDLYIEKEATINQEIDKLRLRGTSALFERSDVIIIASVSCIYGLGNPEDYIGMIVKLQVGDTKDRDDIMRGLIDIHYTRNDTDFGRGTFRAKGDVLEIYPAYGEYGIRVELFGDEIEKVLKIDPVSGNVLSELTYTIIYPAKHFVTSQDKIDRAVVNIKAELEERLKEFINLGKLVERQRLETRVNLDMEMLKEIGYCSGVENYSRHLMLREAGARPKCLIDYFPDDFLLIIDESHVTIPQIRAMYNGDKARKKSLVDNGFRLPSAYDNRPLQFHEFEDLIHQAIYVSATPADYEIDKSQGVFVEQVIRPTGLTDPELVVKPAQYQVDDILNEIKEVSSRNERVLITTLTKRMAEDLTSYLNSYGVKVRYLHSGVDTLERTKIIRDLRLGEFDVLIGVNLLREGLDLPEVSLIGILNADMAGFLRSKTSLIQTIGRAARNINGKVILYADQISDAMRHAIDETNRRRQIQIEYNKKHGIEPQTIKKSMEEIMAATTVLSDADYEKDKKDDADRDFLKELNKGTSSIDATIAMIKKEMQLAAKKLNFERAAELRDRLYELKSIYKLNK